MVSVNSNGGSTTTSFCYSTSSAQTNCSGASSISATPSPVTGSTPSTISATLPSLSPGTTYYVQAVGTNSLGSPTYGALLSFTTAATPTVRTNAATSVNSTTATLNGSFTANGDPNTTTGFCYSTSPSLTNCVGATTTSATPSSVTGSTATSASFNLTGLTPGATYYFQAVATNSQGVLTYGAVRSFTTLTARRQYITSAASGVNASSATLNGSVNPNGATATTSFCYSTSSLLANCVGASTITASPASVGGSTAYDDCGDSEWSKRWNDLLLPSRWHQLGGYDLRHRVVVHDGGLRQR
jgi:hypothetical protein